jgi:ComF family protein
MRFREAARIGARAAGGLALDLLFPPACLGCGAPGGRAGDLCAGCAAAIRPDVEDFHPLSLLEGLDPFGDPAAADAAVRGAAWSTLDGPLRTLVLALKYDGRRSAAAALAEGIAASPAAARLLARVDVVAPVPPETSRLRSRGYHPATWLASALAPRTQGILVSDALARIRPGVSQTRLDPARRKENVAGAFVVRRAHFVRGRRVALVDDVVTTGATASACIEALIGAGAGEVALICAARAFERGRASRGLSFLADR